jgi:hypothetical protein
MFGEGLEVHVLHLLENALCFIEDLPGPLELNLIPPQIL